MEWKRDATSYPKWTKIEAFGDLGLDFVDFGKLLVYVEFGWISRCFKGHRKSIESGIVMAPPWGLSTPRAPKELFNYFLKSDLVTKQVFFLRISTIFCMRETVIISNGSRILPCPLGLKNYLKTKIYFWDFFDLFFNSFWEPLGLSLRGATVGPYI